MSLVILFSTFYVKNTKFYHLVFIGGHLKISKCIKICYIFLSFTNVDWYNRFIQKYKKKSNYSIILCVKFQRWTLFTFFLMLYFIMIIQSFIYHNVIKARWQRSPCEQPEKKNFLKISPRLISQINIPVICILLIVFNLINGMETIS